MPLYEYKCHECGEAFEKMVRLSDLVLVLECPRCGSPDVQKQISSFAARTVGAAAVGGGGSSCGPSGSPFR